MDHLRLSCMAYLPCPMNGIKLFYHEDTRVGFFFLTFENDGAGWGGWDAAFSLKDMPKLSISVYGKWIDVLLDAGVDFKGTA